MKKRSITKLFVTAAMTLTMVASSAAMCFAATGPTATTHAHLTVPVTPVDFTVTEKITMTGTANATGLTVTDLVVTNNAKAGKLNIDSIKATAEPTWNIVADTTDFTRVAKNTNSFSLVADGSHDLTAVYSKVGVLDPAGVGNKNTQTVKFTGKTGIKTVAVTDTKVANLVTTVSFF